MKNDVKDQILEIADKLRNEVFDVHDATKFLLNLLKKDDFILVSEQEPPHDIELLAKSPTGVIHLCSWRPAYDIFTCQDKSESSWDWRWKLI